jgi:hypothetical protein
MVPIQTSISKDIGSDYSEYFNSFFRPVTAFLRPMDNFLRPVDMSQNDECICANIVSVIAIKGPITAG